jgi:tetratricopeptide (TPR) repeat protein
MQLAKARLERGDIAGAQLAAQGVETTGTIINMRIDKRFDVITTADPARFDIDAALARDLAVVRKAAAAAPDKLEGVSETASVLLSTNKTDEALSLIDAALARKKDAGSTPPFSDYDDQINWIENNRAIALDRLGRYDEGLAQLAEAAAKPEGGAANVSQAINLADAYNRAGRPRDALSAVSAVEAANPSPYGHMALSHARACAYAQLNDAVNLSKSIDYIKAHVADAPTILGDALICANDLDGAAAAYIAGLNDPEYRIQILYQFQDFVHSAHPEPMVVELNRRLLAVRDRPDVKAAIETYGRILSLPVANLDSE